MRRLLRSVLAFSVISVALPIASATTVLAALVFLPLPASLPEASGGIQSQISHIYDANGNEIGIFRIFEQSKPVTAEEVPEHLKQAVIAAEDQNFYAHSGVDVQGILRALWADIRSGGFTQGGSTITQQYVRNAFDEVGTERTIARKIREAILAAQLERTEEKEDILVSYLDRVYLGEGAYGVGAAAETYFRKGVADLTLSESALLAGLIPAPSVYAPRGNPEGAEQKRMTVLRAMLDQGRITQQEFDVAAGEQVWLAVEGPPPGPATVVHPPFRQDTRHPYFVDYLRRYLVERYGAETVFRGGLQIFTTLVPEMQVAAEQAVAGTLSGTQPPLQMALASVEPSTGYVRALVGGRDWNVSQVNLALREGGGTGRQPGSSFKPFVLAEAFEQGVSPSRRYSGRSPLVLGGEDFHNYGGSSYGTVDLRAGTRRSVNTVFVQLIRDVGVAETMDLARRLGLGVPEFDPAVYGLSVALGALEVAPLEMASAYSAFANSGRRAPPTPVLRVLDSEGRVLEDNVVAEEVLEGDRAPGEQVLEPVVADNVTAVLEGVLRPGGTAGGRGIGRPAAGKTGTSQDSADAWFVGYTPALSTAVWMGYSDARRPMRGIKGVRAVTGGSWPARTWQAYMRDALADVPVTDFNEPAPIRRVASDLEDGQRVDRRFRLGGRRSPSGPPDGGPYVESSGAPDAGPPPTTSTTTTTTTPWGPPFGPPRDSPDD